MPLSLTIAIPTLNCARTLPETLVSLLPLAQAGAALRVVDSYSTDGTPEIARQFNVPVEQVPPGNMYAAINAGLARFPAEWCTYINGDDLLYADAVLLALKRFGASADVIYGCIDYLDAAGRLLHTWNSPGPGSFLALASNLNIPIPQQGTLFRRQIFEALGGFDVRYRQSADFDFFLRARLRGFSFARLAVPRIAAFRIHSSQMTSEEVQLHEALDSIRRNGVTVSAWRRWLAAIGFRLCNWDSYALRFLRTRHLKGAYKLTRSLSP